MLAKPGTKGDTFVFRHVWAYLTIICMKKYMRSRYDTKNIFQNGVLSLSHKVVAYPAKATTSGSEKYGNPRIKKSRLILVSASTKRTALKSYFSFSFTSLAARESNL